MRMDVMGVTFDNVTMDEAIAKAAALIQEPSASYAVTPNAEIVYECMQDDALLQIVNQADLILPDGSGVVLGAKLLKRPLKERVAGMDFAAHLLSYLSEQGKTLYLLGGKPGIGELAAEKMRQKHPNLQIVGIADGYFQDDMEAVEKINAAAPEVLFVCLGAPKQERFMAAHQRELQVHFMIGLGGSLDGFAGTVKRAPLWMQRAGLEWLYRLVKEPRRFKRMLRLPKFLLAVIGCRLRGG